MTRRIIFCTISLHNMAGGLEKNIVRVANYLASRGHDVSLATFDLPDAFSFFPLNPAVTWHKVGRTAPHGRIGFFERLKLIKRLRSVLPTNPDQSFYMIAFHHGILLRLWLAAFGLRRKIICSERNALSLYDHVRASRWNLNFLMLYATQIITVQFERYKNHYPVGLRRRVRTIPNVVEAAQIEAQPDKPNARGRYTMLAVGRLCDQKQYGPLIEAFSSLAMRYPLWDLHIIGTGILEHELRDRIKQSGLTDRIRLIEPASDRLEEFYASAHLYCMPSKWEGFPNALAEAMAHGLPVVGYARCAGVSDLVGADKAGFLADGHNSAPALALSLERLMNDPALRRDMGRQAKKTVAAYAPERVFPLWEALILS